MPVGFMAHGAPTLALDAERGADFRRWGAALAKPSALLVVSAHWESAPVSIGTTETRALLYDFHGFQDPLYQVRYPAPGAPELAARVAALLGDGVRREPARALDHGVWVPLVHMFPDAGVPVLQLSMPSTLGSKQLFLLGQRLAPLRDEGVLLLGSGNLTHNLGRLDWGGNGGTPAWAAEFDAWIAGVLVRHDFDALVDYREKAPALRQNHPTEEHLQPLLVVAGAASAGTPPVSFPVRGFEFGSLSRRSVQLG
jgi:4,5-DOPA dioxygenase extradiol